MTKVRWIFGSGSVELGHYRIFFRVDNNEIGYCRESSSVRLENHPTPIATSGINKVKVHRHRTGAILGMFSNTATVTVY